MKLRFLLVFLIVILCSYSVLDVFAKKNIIYSDKISGKVTKTKIFIKKNVKDLDISKSSSDGISKYLYSEKFKLKKFNYTSSQKPLDISFHIDDIKLICEGTVNGIKKSSVHYIPNLNWVQDFTFGLRPFLKSSKNDYKFLLIKLDTFAAIDMIAIKQGIEPLEINNTKYNTQKVKITLPGFKSHFWKAEVWYDLNTLDMVKYISNEGPGTPQNIITIE
ncbi:MAG: hypothetical protein JXA94_07070 [Parachlamydiales bacterium]|nr:hypothetical protein [Parachlamydiales bacterium]